MEKHRSKIADKLLFLKRFILEPSKIGSVTPSSRYLVKEMLSKVDWANCRSIAELGAGTGVFSGKIAENMPCGRLMVFEIDENLRNLIKIGRVSSEVTLHSNAEDLPAVAHSFGLEKVDCIISSLPFTVLPAVVSENILRGVVECLAPGGKFVAYQYSRIMQKELKKRFKSIERTFVLRNIPPAFVYVCKDPVK